MRRRVRITLSNPTVPAWLIDFQHGAKYRIIRPDAAAEVISIEAERLGRYLHQPDTEDIERITPRKPLVQEGEWRIQRTDIPLRDFGG